MAIKNTVSIDFYPRSAIDDSVFDCRLPGVKLVFTVHLLTLSADNPKHEANEDSVFLFDLILYIPVNIFSVMSGLVFLG